MKGWPKKFEMASAQSAARTIAGLTQEELAQRMSAKQSRVARWVTKNLLALCERLGRRAVF